MATYEIPLSGANQSFAIQLGATNYVLTVLFRDATDAGWMLDIADAEAAPIICGIPLVTGADLLAQYAHLGLGGSLTVVSEDDLAPTFEGLGTTSKLYWTDA